MGLTRLRNIITATVRPGGVSSSSAPSLSKKLLIRTASLVALASLVGVSTAADRNEQSHTATAPSSAKQTSINLDSTADTTTPAPAPTVVKSDDNTTTTSSNISSGGASNTATSSINVSVNDQPVDVPTNGTTSQVITNPDGGSTTVTINNNSTTNGTNFSATSTTSRAASFGVDRTVQQESKYGSP